MNSTDGQMWRYSSFVLQCYNNTNKCTTDECVVWSTWVCVPVCRSNNNIFCFDCVDRRTVLFDTLWMNERGETTHINKFDSVILGWWLVARCQLRVHFWLRDLGFFFDIISRGFLSLLCACLFWHNDVKNHQKSHHLWPPCACLLNLMILIF